MLNGHRKKILLSVRGKTLLFHHHALYPDDTWKEKNISVFKVGRGQKYAENFPFLKKTFQKVFQI